MTGALVVLIAVRLSPGLIGSRIASAGFQRQFPDLARVAATCAGDFAKNEARPACSGWRDRAFARDSNAPPFVGITRARKLKMDA